MIQYVGHTMQAASADRGSLMMPKGIAFAFIDHSAEVLPEGLPSAWLEAPLASSRSETAWMQAGHGRLATASAQYNSALGTQG